MSNNAPEYTSVEQPFIEQLQGLGWQYLGGDIDVPYLTGRQSFREVLLTERLKKVIRALNLDDNGQPWLDDTRVNQAVGTLERLGAPKLMEANQKATQLLLLGTTVEGDPVLHKGRGQTVRFIDYEHPERNEFLVINQFRVDIIGTTNYIVPDIVLFVNGIPLVVVECKSPTSTDPIEEGITQLLRYSNQRDWVEGDEGVEKLFYYNQLLISTFNYKACFGTVGASYEHYLEWKDTSPVPLAQVAAQLGVDKLNSQQMLIAGMLRPAHLLDLVQNFSLFQQSSGKTIKVMARYQQFRAVHEAIRRLQKGQTKAQHGLTDQRGGIIWHTQGSGKSLTMVFLVRKMRTNPTLRSFKVVVVTDRKDLEKQLRETAALTGETVSRAINTNQVKKLLKQPGADLVFAMIQKYQSNDENEAVKEPEQFSILNESAAILVLVDEAHRSQTNTFHANLMQSLPNCAKIGFTGTPIIVGDRKRTQDIFGEFIDRYTILQSQEDGATVPILYESFTADAEVADERTLDQLFEDMFKERTPKELEAIKRKYATEEDVLEAEKMIAAKAESMLHHYVDSVLPGGFKAQVVAVSRRAAIRYREALVKAHLALVAKLESLDLALLSWPLEVVDTLDVETRFLIRAYPYLNTIRRLEFAAAISGSTNDVQSWKEWSEPSKTDAHITRFKKPLNNTDPTKQDGLAFLCVKSMLLTGFDAPVEQVLYLDRKMKDHELLQAIARVNRTYLGKQNGLVVDYFGVARHLKEALAVYNSADIKGVITNLKDELPLLTERHKRILAVFHDRGVLDISNKDVCVNLLRDVKIRAEFVAKFKQFLDSLDTVMPRPEALPYLKDAKLLGFINKAAANLYRDSELNLVGAGHKVRQLIDQYIETRGVNPKTAPISILAADFEKAVSAHASDRTKASEMEHAARYYINQHYQEDPTYYKKLSERLEEIIKRLQDNQQQSFEELWNIVQDIRQGRPKDESGLDPKTQAPFLGLLVEELKTTNPMLKEQLVKLAGYTVEMITHVSQELRVVDFWRNKHAQDVLRGWIIQFLDDNDIVSFNRQEALADKIVELAKIRHTDLVL